MRRVTNVALKPQTPMSYAEEVVAAQEKFLAMQLIRCPLMMDLSAFPPTVLIDDSKGPECVTVLVIPSGKTEAVVVYVGPAKPIVDLRIIMYKFDRDGWTYTLTV